MEQNINKKTEENPPSPSEHKIEDESLPKKKQLKLEVPSSNILNVSSKKNPKVYKLISKIILKQYGNIEIRSLGNAAECCIVLAEGLVRNGFAEFERIDSDTTLLEDFNNEEGSRKGIQFSIKLTRSENFDQITPELESLKLSK